MRVCLVILGQPLYVGPLIPVDSGVIMGVIMDAPVDNQQNCGFWATHSIAITYQRLHHDLQACPRLKSAHA